MKICLDAGHYGYYNQSPANNKYYESIAMWKLHLLLKKYLEGYGIEVIQTRSDQTKDKPIFDRGAVARGCDLFISVHSNAVGVGVNNTIDYPVSYCAVNGKADTVGLLLARTVEKTMGTSQSARIEHRSGQSGDYYGVLRGATVVGTPAIILEHSFHTNKTATDWLLNDTNLDQLSKNEADSIAMYYGILKPIQEKKSGWVEEAGSWKYYNGDTGEYVKDDWCCDDGKWYWFDGNGRMIMNSWYQYNGHWYFLGSNGAMVKGLQQSDGKWYCLDQEGKLITKPFTLTPDKGGALQL